MCFFYVEPTCFFLFLLLVPSSPSSNASQIHLARSGQVLSYPQCRLGRGLVARVLEVALQAREQGGRLHGFFSSSVLFFSFPSIVFFSFLFLARGFHILSREQQKNSLSLFLFLLNYTNGLCCRFPSPQRCRVHQQRPLDECKQQEQQQQQRLLLLLLFSARRSVPVFSPFNCIRRSRLISWPPRAFASANQCIRICDDVL